MGNKTKSIRLFTTKIPKTSKTKN